VPEINLAALRAEIELEREWRDREMRDFRNRVATIADEDERRIARKALIVMLYAHFEGVSKALLAMYANNVNRLGLKVSDVSCAIGAASLSDVFVVLRDPQRKCPEFANTLPDDSALHRFARDKDFIGALWRVAERSASLDTEVVVDTESNLRPVVLKKILFRLGLDPETVRPWEGSLHWLLNKRNDVAHGTAKLGFEEKEYAEVETAVARAVDGLVTAITNAVTQRAYRASQAPAFHNAHPASVASAGV
jgi:hypothetical protein